MGSVNLANQNCDFKCSVIDPMTPRLETKWQSGKQQFIRFATFLWIILNFCNDILTKCFYSIQEQGYYISTCSYIDFGGICGVKIQQISSATFLWLCQSIYFYITPSLSGSRLKCLYFYFFSLISDTNVKCPHDFICSILIIILL